MRKITSLLMLFCMCVGMAFAQTLPATNKAFKVENNRGALAINNDGTALIGTPNVAIADVAQKNFAFVQHDGKVYLYSVWASKFVNKDCSLTNSLPVDAITVENVADGKFFFKFDDAHNVNLGGSGQIAVNDWGTKDAGNQFTLVENGDFDPTAALAILDNSCTITYNFTYNGNVFATQVTKVNKGANYPAFTSLPWGASATVPTGNPTDDETIEIVCTVDTSVLPFVPSATYDDANMKWYYLNIGDDAYYLYHTAGADHIALNKKAVDESAKDAYSWAFIGNPFTGYKIVNRATGNGYVLSSSTNTFDGNTGGYTFPIMTAEPVGDGKNTYWEISISPDRGGVGAFYIAQKDANNGMNRMNNRGSKLAYWNGGADAGSTFKVVERPMGLVAELEALIANAQTLLSTVNANLGTQLGEYSQETANALAAAITTAQGKGDAATAEDVATLQAAMNAVKVILPTVGQYYQFHSSLAAFPETKALYSNGNQPRWKTLNNDDKSFYWKAVDAGNGNVVLQNAADGKYLAANAEQSGAWTVVDTPTAASNVDLKIFNKENAKGYEYGVVLNGWQMHCSGHGSGAGTESNIVSWNTNSANSASSWFVVPVELKVFHEVTYNFVYNEEVKYTQKTSVAEGAAYPAVVVPVLPYGVTTNAATPDGNVTGAKSFNFTLTVEHPLPFKTAADVNSITTWYYAQMHGNPAVTAYVEDNQNENNNVEWADKAVAADEIESHLWGFAGDIWNGIKMVNKGTGRAIVSTSGDAVMGDKANATAFVPVYSNAVYNEWFCLKYPNNSNHLNASGGKISSWWDDDNGSSFFLTEYVEIPVVVSEAGYSTLYLGQATYIPAEVEAYAVTGVENGYAMMTQVEGVLPKNTGVVLKNTGDYTFKVAGATGSVEGNLLLGSTEDTYVEGDALVLSKQDGVVGFYKAQLNCGSFGEAGGSHFKNNANKAYLPMTATQGANMLRFNFGGETTAIDAVEVENANAPIYDLSGRRVLTTVKGGVYIQNGKKFIVK